MVERVYFGAPGPNEDLDLGILEALVDELLTSQLQNPTGNATIDLIWRELGVAAPGRV